MLRYVGKRIWAARAGGRSRPEKPVRAVDVTLDPAELSEGDEQPGRRTVFYKDVSKTVLTRNNSPDIGYDVLLNPYRGCEHGCTYCYARQTHEYLGFSPGLDFESKIMVKDDAPTLLGRELAAKSWRPQLVGMGGVTDVYQPVERKSERTRRCLEVFPDFPNPVGLVTKSHLVTRDLDPLQELTEFQAVSVAVSLTTLEDELWRAMEPRAASPARRLDAARKLAGAGVRVGVLSSPIIPGLNDHEMPGLVAAAAEAGAQFAGYGVVHLPYGVKDLFARADPSGAGGQNPEPHPGNTRRQPQRPAFRAPDARRGGGAAENGMQAFYRALPGAGPDHTTGAV